MEESKFKELIEEQVKNKQYYKANNNVPNGGIIIEIKNNKIEQVKEGNGKPHATRKIQYIELIKRVLERYELEDCIVKINLNDHPIKGCFGFCRVKGDKECYLLPNHRFTNDDITLDKDETQFKTFDEQREFIRNKTKKYEKKTKIYSSFIPQTRHKIEYLQYALNNKDLCEGWAYTGSVHGKAWLSQNHYEILKDNNLAGDEKAEWVEHLKYKYNIYIEGNTLSDRMRLLLCTESILLYLKSNYEEFYTYKLRNKENYVEIENIEEIRRIIETNEKSGKYDNIIENNKRFVEEELNYDEILKYTYLIIKEICCEE